MMPTVPENKDKMIKMIDVMENGDLAVTKILLEYGDKIEESKKEIKETFKDNKKDIEDFKDLASRKIEDFKKETSTDLNKEVEKMKKEAIGPKGDRGENYILNDKDKEEIAKSIPVPIVDRVIERTEVIHEQPLITEQKIENPVLPHEIVDKINGLPIEPYCQIEPEHIRGLLEEFEALKLLVKRQGGISGGVIGRDFIKDYDLSSSLDGVTKTFSIPATWTVLSVNLSSFPYGALRNGIDFTNTPTTITFTSEIDALTQLSSGQTCKLLLVTA